jgi:putative SOS response-associated peptidase YedK
MCGRIGQFSAWQSYVEALALFRDVTSSDLENYPRYNVGPGAKTIVLYSDGSVRRVWWGFRPHWAVARKIPQMINARGDKITGSTWKPMLKSSRVIVPADVWFEWIKDDDGKKQPYLLRAKDKAPLFLAGLTNVTGDVPSGPREGPDGAGLVDGAVIVTDASDAGMIDIHDRRPVVLSAADAKHWLDQDTTVEHAAEIARTASRPVSDFEWFKVSREVNDARHDNPGLVDPIE